MGDQAPRHPGLTSATFDRHSGASRNPAVESSIPLTRMACYVSRWITAFGGKTSKLPSQYQAKKRGFAMPDMQIHVAVLMGGLSSEREVSLRSGAACATALEGQGYRVSRLDVGRDVAARLAELRPDVCFNAL